MRRSQKFLLSLTSGLLLWLAWPPLPFFPLLLIAFVPILWLEEICSGSAKSGGSFFGYAYLALLVWNICTTWWVGATVLGTKDISTAIAGAIANTANPLLMCIPIIGYQRTKRRLGETWGYLSLVAYWITFEFIHLRWDLSWPWLTLGNGLSGFPQVIQWYEYTGALGGTLWILVTNIFIFKLLKNILARNVARSLDIPAERNSLTVKDPVLIGIVCLIVFPISLSLLRYTTYSEKGKEQEVVVIQPNVDPYGEKFDPGMFERNLDKLIQLSKSSIDKKTDYLVWPETAIQENIIVNDIDRDKTITKIEAAFDDFPNLKIVCGINAYALYNSRQTSTARYSKDGKFYWDAFNTAIQIDSSGKIPYYHKSKLVPGVEQMPYPQVFGFLESLALQMGGTSGSLGKQRDRTVFNSADSVKVAPMICYESIYGEYAAKYVRNGGNILFIITNDGWWGNTAGYKQHLEYARLRAIETRRDIARSANTGISAFINQRGEILQATSWWKQAVIKATLHVNSEITFYVRYGDFIGRAACILTILIAAYAFIQRFRTKKKIAEGNLIPAKEANQ